MRRTCDEPHALEFMQRLAALAPRLRLLRSYGALASNATLRVPVLTGVVEAACLAPRPLNSTPRQHRGAGELEIMTAFHELAAPAVRRAGALSRRSRAP